MYLDVYVSTPLTSRLFTSCLLLCFLFSCRLHSVSTLNCFCNWWICRLNVQCRFILFKISFHNGFIFLEVLYLIRCFYSSRSFLFYVVFHNLSFSFLVVFIIILFCYRLQFHFYHFSLLLISPSSFIYVCVSSLFFVAFTPFSPRLSFDLYCRFYFYCRLLMLVWFFQFLVVLTFYFSLV